MNKQPPQTDEDNDSGSLQQIDTPYPMPGMDISFGIGSWMFEEAAIFLA